jgi:Spy/CpxP family protein refolding chaperone
MAEGPRQSPGGKWWDNPETVRQLGITAEQQKKMDDAWQQNRLKLIDLSAALEKEETVMEGLLKGPQLDDSKILPAIDRIAQARAELEKTNARLMLAIRHVLTPEQWEKLNQQGPRPRRGGPGGPMPGQGRGPGQGGPPHE